MKPIEFPGLSSPYGVWVVTVFTDPVPADWLLLSPYGVWVVTVAAPQERTIAEC